MSTEIKGVRDIIIFGKRNISNFKEKSDDSTHTKNKSYQIKNNNFILFIAYYFILLKTRSNIYLKDDPSLNLNIFISFYMISSVIYRYIKTHLISLNIFPNFDDIYLDF